MGTLQEPLQESPGRLLGFCSVGASSSGFVPSRTVSCTMPEFVASVI